MIDALLVESFAVDDDVREFFLRVQREMHARIGHVRGECRDLVGATRDQALSALADADGVTFFAHGVRDHVVAADGSALFDGADVNTLKGKWCHALSCLTAADHAPNSLANLAAPHADVYAGYASEIRVPIFLDSLDDSNVGARVVDLACALSCELADGCFDEKALRAVVIQAWSALMGALDEALANGRCDPMTLTSVSQITKMLWEDLRLVGVGLR